MSDLQACLWLDADIAEAARFYASAFPNSEIRSIDPAPADYVGGKKGDPITVDMTISGRSVMLLAGGEHFAPTPASSLMLVTEDQAETDAAWNALLEAGGQPMACGWITDHYGFAWQITPRRLLDLLGDEKTAAAAFAAMQEMAKIDIAALDAAVG
ncbi:VOC family protein [Sphingomicrobium sediminis]|uniref:VOC family protein n=1 Tax=Sphingomicrobium sediminis TaxID=2950949 RepID=A0A9X2J535_9SPHN|nr:VOC family protein [Sphingomicrobium sediminis]MCM8557847.1 VOC family protein [Sphingomicrobium sediminis]